MAKSAHSRSRDRRWALLAVVVMIALGLASRRYPGMFPAFLGKYPGDALWAAMVYFGWAVVLPAAPPTRIAALALLSALAIELLKLYHAPWLVNLRHTTLGHLVFGHVFSWHNLLAYALGVGLAWGCEVLVNAIRRG